MNLLQNFMFFFFFFFFFLFFIWIFFFFSFLSFFAFFFFFSFSCCRNCFFAACWSACSLEGMASLDATRHASLPAWMQSGMFLLELLSIYKNGFARCSGTGIADPFCFFGLIKLCCRNLYLSISIAAVLDATRNGTGIAAACRNAGMPECRNGCFPECLHACMPACLHACMPACLHACMPACLHACMPACRP